MPGRPDFSSAGTAGGGQVVAVNERPEIEVVVVQETANVAAGTKEATEIYAPTGAVYEVTTARLYCPTEGTATSGTHLMRILPVNARSVTFGESNYTTRLLFDQGNWRDADSRAEPGSSSAQTMAVQSLYATENSPIKVEYQNNMDVAQSNARDIELVVREVSY